MYKMIVTRVSNLKYRSDFYDIINHRNIKKAAEIGVEFGYNARDILSHIPSIKTLYLIDPFDGSLTKKKWWEKDRLFNQCKKNMEPVQDRIIYVRKKSWKAYKDFEDDFFDFIHIDGAHYFHGVIKDILYWWPKVKDGCVFSGHDYYSKSKKRNVLPIINWIFKDKELFCTNECRRKNGNSPSWFLIKEGDLNFDFSILNKKKIHVPREYYYIEEEYKEIFKY